MDPEVEAQCPSAEMARSSLVKIRILVVDDDSTALLVVTEVLRKWNYEGIVICYLTFDNHKLDPMLLFLFFLVFCLTKFPLISLLLY